MNLQLFFDRLRAERERLKLTQDQMVLKTGVSKRSYCAYESGETAPSAKLMAALVVAGFDIPYLLTGQRSQAVAEVDLLPSDERVLVDAYRRCNAQAKQALIQTAALLSAGMAAPSKAAKASKSVKVGGSVSGNAVVVAGTVAGGIANGRKK
jgi:transcriptional regulator with XRE-family HTH domain